MFTKNFESLNENYLLKVKEENDLRVSIEGKLKEVLSEKAEIVKSMAKEFIDNYTGTPEQFAYILSEYTPLSSELYHFSNNKIFEKGFKNSTYNAETGQKNLYIDISEKEQIEKAVDNINWAFEIIKPATHQRTGKMMKLIQLYILALWDWEKFDADIYVVDNRTAEDDFDYKIIVMKNNGRIEEFCQGNDLIDMIENKVIPMLNKEYSYGYEEEESWVDNEED